MALLLPAHRRRTGAGTGVGVLRPAQEPAREPAREPAQPEPAQPARDFSRRGSRLRTFLRLGH